MDLQYKVEDWTVEQRLEYLENFLRCLYISITGTVSLEMGHWTEYIERLKPEIKTTEEKT